MNGWMYIRMEIGNRAGWGWSFPPSCLSHTPSLTCSISSPRSGPGTAASCSFSASGRMHCLKRWAWMRPGWGVGRLTVGPGGPWSQGCQHCRTAQLFSMSLWPHILAAFSIGTMRATMGSSTRPCPLGLCTHGPLVTAMVLCMWQQNLI